MSALASRILWGRGGRDQVGDLDIPHEKVRMGDEFERMNE